MPGGRKDARAKRLEHAGLLEEQGGSRSRYRVRGPRVLGYGGFAGWYEDLGLLGRVAWGAWRGDGLKSDTT